MKILKTILLLPFLFLIAAVSEEIDQSNIFVYDVEDFRYFDIYRQNFRAGINGNLIAIEIFASKRYNPSNMELHLYKSNENNDIIGQRLASGFLQSSLVPNGDSLSQSSWIRVDLQVPYKQSAGEYLTFYFTEPNPYGGSDGYYSTGYTISDNYQNGYYSNPYSPNIQEDMSFKTIISASITQTTSSNLIDNPNNSGPTSPIDNPNNSGPTSPNVSSTGSAPYSTFGSSGSGGGGCLLSTN